MDRIDFEEWTLKTVDPSFGPSVQDIVSKVSFFIFRKKKKKKNTVPVQESNVLKVSFLFEPLVSNVTL